VRSLLEQVQHELEAAAQQQPCDTEDGDVLKVE
jgi:hypothetical protein